LNINEEDLEDDDEFMDDTEDRTRAGGQTKSKNKYMNILQDIADRTTSHISIDLDDLDTVSHTHRVFEYNR